MTAVEAGYHVERMVLRTAMERASSLPDMPLQPHHFASEQHAEIWETIQRLALDGLPTDAVSVMDALDRAGRKGLSVLPIDIAAASDIYATSNAAYYAGIMVEAWRNRRARDVALELQSGLKRREEGAVDVAIAGLMQLYAETSSSEQTAQSAMQAALAHAEDARRNGGGPTGVPTGLGDLDETLGGLHDSDLIVIGARPAMGKTGLLLGMTTAGAKGGPVGLVSGEQPADQVGLRWMAAGSGVTLGRLRAGRFDGRDMMAMEDAAERYGRLPIRILDRSAPDITEVIREARRWKHQYGIRALYVDYLQRLEIASMAKSPKHERVGQIARSLKNLARDLRIPVIALAQVSRLAANDRPQMAHLADSSEIEKEADQIMMLWRDLSNPQAERAAAEINVVKNRHGNIGTVYCTWHGGSTSFVNRSPSDEFEEAA